MAEPAITLDRITRRFGDRAAVDDVSLSLAEGRILALLGPSGGGKTTLLRLIAGLEAPDAGTLSIAGRPVAGPGLWMPVEQRGVALVFQDLALFPHMTALQNVAFGLKGATSDRRARALAWLDRVGLADLAHRHPHALSGGEQQRVALARALAPEPRVVLFDEPFSALDAHLRQSVRDDVARLLRDSGASAVIVTHDAQEAMGMVDALAILEGGRLIQMDTPQAVYDHPITATAARLLGPVNLLPGQAEGGAVETPFGRVASAQEGPVQIAVRPERLHLAQAGLAGHVAGCAFAGDCWIATVETTAGPLRVRVSGPTQGQVHLVAEPGAVRVLPG
ncbi:ABC transporter ATP-binding protein [Brevundimonas bacteroides]|uniref:ABC transporter ATP-binding protein n=1 Tax=Brevundimonas bacteroides TaxID=74311 RepID=UPI0004959FA8|nr:ABC transporter ATP-binding protein [Brevundimonas bacteroides]